MSDTIYLSVTQQLTWRTDCLGVLFKHKKCILARTLEHGPESYLHVLSPTEEDNSLFTFKNILISNMYLSLSVDVVTELVFFTKNLFT